MKKFAISALLFLFPALVLGAEGSSLSFAPPPSDVSVIFLGNLFGVVDGVLHGSGSQIMGAMFSVFNSAVLALGGLVIMYTLMVSTMNTAHEGQMLGQKWSSIWIPVRSTMGLALLIPKASGYCLMQIFVMWIVVQGVGAADKVWEAALSYLNRGGVIIQSQSNPVLELLEGKDQGIAGGALNILSGQVCMIGLQKQLELQRQEYLDAKQNKSGPCSGTPEESMAIFCNTAVPDFVSTVNAVLIRNKNKNASSYEAPMPNFDSASKYSFLNGICGTIKWNAIEGLNSTIAYDYSGPTDQPTMKQSGVSEMKITESELETTQMSRAIAVQQMYLSLATVARVMVNNNPALSPKANNNPDATKPFSLVATQQFGVPYSKNGAVCKTYNQKCETWGAASSSSGIGVLFNGTEFLGAVSDYNAIMKPALVLLEQAKKAQQNNNAREFINDAKTQGWMMAGSYFFDLVKLQGNVVDNPDLKDLKDKNTGLDETVSDPSSLLSAFDKGDCAKSFTNLCIWFGKDSSKLKLIIGLIDGSMLTIANGKPVEGTAIPKPILKDNPDRALIDGLPSSTVYGFVNNSVMVQLPGQPGVKPLKFANVIHFTVDPTMMYMKEQNFPCGAVKLGFFSFCFGQMIGDIFYNLIFIHIYNLFLTLFQQIINQVIMAFLMIPLTGMSDIFKDGLQTISQPGVNPVIALAKMGVHYINFAGGVWLMLLNISVISALIPIFGFFIMPLLALALPIVMCWLGIMVAIGFITAYYIPLLPYVIFTFGTIGWLIAVIEAMVAAPIVALGVTHPEGHDAFGKGEAAIMILMNVFLRPAMMIIGYISAIALSYVGVWILNAGFSHAIGFIQQGDENQQAACGVSSIFRGSAENLKGCGDIIKNQAAAWKNDVQNFGSHFIGNRIATKGSGTGEVVYSEWAGIFAFFFSILSYTTMYMILVQKSFTLIAILPDKVLRWIGGSPEGYGEQAAQWGEEVKQGTKEGGDKAFQAQQQVDKQLGGYGAKGVDAIKSATGQATGGGGSAKSTGTGGKGLGSKNKGSQDSKTDGGDSQPGDGGGGDTLPGGGAGAE